MDMTVEVPELPELTFDEASHIYRLNGDIIPSVSKLMEPLKDQCYGGISKRTLENAAIKGSAVHNSIENWIKFGIDDIPSEHRGYFNGFMEWWKQYKPRVFGSEVRIYHTSSLASCTALTNGWTARSCSRTKSTERRPCERRRSASSRADRNRSTRTLSSTGWEIRIVPTAERT